MAQSMNRCESLSHSVMITRLNRSTKQRRRRRYTMGELSCSALPVALPFYLTELRKRKIMFLVLTPDGD